MTGKNQLYYLMQLAGGTFPSGGFSQSWGLETYVTQNIIKSGDDFKEFAGSYLSSTISRCEGPILCEAYNLAQKWDIDKIVELETLSYACKVTYESRRSSLRMGRAFLRITAEILENEELNVLKKQFGGNGITYPVIFGIVCGILNIEVEESVRAFVFNTVNGLVQSAVKLIPLGNTEAQRILLGLHNEMEQCSRESIKWPVDNISNFCPGFDIAGILHETLPVRLYMS